MKDQELAKVLKSLEYIPNESERTEAMEIILKAAAESITMERLKKISSYREETKKRKKNGKVLSNSLKRR